jgi:hypothetical protein
MPDGQAHEAPGTVDDLAKFLADNPELIENPQDEDDAAPRVRRRTRAAEGADKPEDEPNRPAPESGEDKSPEDKSEEKPKAGPEDEDEDEDEENPEALKQTSGRKYRVVLKGEDGSDHTELMSVAQMAEGMMLKADYSRKRAAEETERQHFAQKTIEALESRRGQQLQQLEALSRSADALLGVVDQNALAQLAQSDPGAWVAAQQRLMFYEQHRTQIRAAIQAEIEEGSRVQKGMEEQAKAKAWIELETMGIDRPKLRTLYDNVTRHYGIEEHRFETVNDPKLIAIMRDAVAYRQLREKTAAITRQAQDAPRLPSPRQPVPHSERVTKALDARFKTGKATMNDLAAYFDNTGL